MVVFHHLSNQQRHLNLHWTSLYKGLKVKLLWLIQACLFSQDVGFVLQQNITRSGNFFPLFTFASLSPLSLLLLRDLDFKERKKEREGAVEKEWVRERMRFCATCFLPDWAEPCNKKMWQKDKYWAKKTPNQEINDRLRENPED